MKYSSRIELWNLAAGSMVGGEASFYEPGETRDERLRNLVHAVVREPDGFAWLCRFVPYLRNEMYMRTAPIIIAAEAARTHAEAVRVTPSLKSPSFTVRRLVASAIGRTDEFAEFIGYWRMRFGRTIPGGVQRGLADAFVSSLDEYGAMKYDGNDRPIRLGDVVEILHPEPKNPAQSDLFRYLMDRRHHPSDIRVGLERLPMIASRRVLEDMPQTEREALVVSPGFTLALKNSGMTWENVAGWLRRKLTAREWEALIPTMGYMALLRNLRNLDDAGISDEVAAQVVMRLTDPAQIARSKQFPYRFYTAYRAAQETFRWSSALGKALDLSTQNIPVLNGNTLVLVDTSASMETPISARSNVEMVDVAALFSAALAARNPDRVDVISFATSARKIEFPTRSNVLRNVDHLRGKVGLVGHGTNVNAGIAFLEGKKYDRMIILSDMQDVAGLSESRRSIFGFRDRPISIPDELKVYSFNLGGYEYGTVDTSIPNRYILSGFSDAAFRMMEMAELPDQFAAPADM